MVSKYEILGIVIGVCLIAGSAVLADYKINTLKKQNAELTTQVNALETSLKAEKARADFAESVAVGLTTLNTANTVAEQAKVVYVNKVKNIEVKTATDYNNLVSELEESWKCEECQ